MSTLLATVQFIKELPFQKLVIPDYQRPYVWQLKELRQLWDDILQSLAHVRKDYRIGTIILHKNAESRKLEDFVCKTSSDTSKLRVIEVLDGQLITQQYIGDTTIVDGNLVSNIAQDILKMVVVNRYEKSAPIAIGFVKNFGLNKGAIASSVAHDSHNIIAIGVNDEEICKVVNLLIEIQGGVAVVESESNFSESLPLEIAGLMSIKPGEKVAELYAAFEKDAKAQFLVPHAQPV